MNRKQVMSMLGVLPQFETDALNEERFVDTVESGMEEMNEWKVLSFRKCPVLPLSESGVFSGKKSRSKPGGKLPGKFSSVGKRIRTRKHTVKNKEDYLCNTF